MSNSSRTRCNAAVPRHTRVCSSRTIVAERTRQAGHVPGRHENSAAVVDEIGDAAHWAGNDAQPVGHRFQDRHRLSFDVRRQHQHLRRPKNPLNFERSNPTCDVDGVLETQFANKSMGPLDIAVAGNSQPGRTSAFMVDDHLVPRLDQTKRSFSFLDPAEEQHSDWFAFLRLVHGFRWSCGVRYDENFGARLNGRQTLAPMCFREQ